MVLGNIHKTIDTCLSISSPIENRDIQRAKDYLSHSYDNAYTISPHITYLLIPLPSYSLDCAEQAIDLYLANQTKFLIKLTDMVFEFKNKFFFIRVEGSTVRRLHNDMVALINRHRNNFIRKKDADRIEQRYYDNAEIKNILRYGYPRVYDQFNPHITIGNIRHEAADITEIKRHLAILLEKVVNTEIEVARINIMWHSDSLDQSEMKVLWEKEYRLL